jgi:hypothetical protein
MLLRSAAVLMILGGVCHADPSSPSAPPADALGGPKVSDTAVPGTKGAGFGGDSSNARKDRQRELPQPVWMKALRDALGENAPEAIRATPEQMDKFRKLNEEFASAQREYMRKHGDEIRALREKYGGRRGGPGQGPGPGDEMRPPEPPADPAQREAFMQDMQTLRANAPQAGDLRKKIWAELSPEQQKAVEIKVAEAEKEMADRMMQNQLPGEAKRLRERMQDREGGNFTPKNADRAGGQPIPREQMDRIAALLGRMTPEQREQLIARIEQRMASEGRGEAKDSPAPPKPPEGQGQPRRRRPRGGGDNPPPPPGN